MRRAELGGALVGGSVAVVAFFGTAVAVGTVGDFEALSLIESVLPTARFLASSAIAAGATVLALLLTLLGLSLDSNLEFSDQLYSRARYITGLSTAAILLGVLVLLAVTVPLQEVDGMRGFYGILYYVLAGVVSLLGGVVVTVGLMISATLVGLINLGHPDGTNELLADHQPAEPTEPEMRAE